VGLVARKRTKKEALDRISSVDLVPDVSDINSPRLKALADQLETLQGMAKFGAAGLVMLDPLNRLADDRIVIPIDMVAIPAYELGMVYQGIAPSMKIYIRAGETILPTGGNVRDVQEVVQENATQLKSADSVKAPRKPNKRAKMYGKAFSSLAPKYKLKNGKWKKDGFRRCVKAAHAHVRKEMK